MILYREEPYPIQMKNVMLLDDTKSGGVVYVNKTTYDQALLLSGRLDGDPKRVLDILRSPRTEAYRATMGLNDLVDGMMSSMPKPINMLAPFLVFCVQNQGIKWDANDREFAYGILHQFSQLVDFNAITLVPVEVRNNITVPTSILMDYKTSWDDLCSSLTDKVVLNGMNATPTPAPQPVVIQQPVQQASPTVVAPQPTSSEQPVQGQPAQPAQVQSEDDVAARIKAFQEKMAREAEEEKKEREAKAAKRKAAQESAGLNTAVTTPKTTSAAEAKKASNVLDSYNFD